MRLEREKGGSRLSSLFWLLLLAALGYGSFKVAPVYFANYSLRDRMTEVARLSRGVYPDDKLREILFKEVRERGLQDYVKTFHITTMETARRISCEYERVEEVLPGIRWRFHFLNDVEQPVF